MKPQIAIKFYLPETIPLSVSFPIRVAEMRLIPPGQRSPISFGFDVGLTAEGYTILVNGEETGEEIDSLPEATMRAALALCQEAVPEYLHRHIRDYAKRVGVERAFGVG